MSHIISSFVDIFKVAPKGDKPPESFPTSMQPLSLKDVPPVTYSSSGEVPKHLPFVPKAPKLPSEEDFNIAINYLTETEEYQKTALGEHKLATARKTKAYDKTRAKRFKLSKDLALQDAPVPVWMKVPSLLAASFATVQGGVLAVTNPLAGTVMMLSGAASVYGTVAGESNFKKLGYLAIILSAGGAASTFFSGANTPLSFNTLKETAYTFINGISGIGSMKQAIVHSRKARVEGESVILDAKLDKDSKELFSASNLKRIASLEQAAAEILSNWVRDQSDIKREINNQTLQG